MSKRVLLICYYFPPLGLGGVGRPLNLFKRLPQYGWSCEILTVKPVLYRAYEPELLDGLDAALIHRSGSYDPQRLLYMLGIRRMKASTISSARPIADKFFPDSKIGWVAPATRLGNKLCRSARYDAIISTSPPISCHLVGQELARRHKIPWIADFRDFWTIYKAEEVYSGESDLGKARMLLDVIRGQTAAITAVNGSIVEYLRMGEVMPNGYDPDLAELWRQPPSEEMFTIGLLGHQHDTREIEPLLKLLEQVKSLDAERFKRIRLLQVGQVDALWLQRLFTERGLGIKLDLRQRQPRRDTIRILSEAHALYLGVSDKEGPGFLPGRMFELLASGRPLLIYARPGSEVARVAEPSGRACRFDEDGCEAAAEVLLEQMRAFDNRTCQYRPLDEYSRQFSADRLAQRFADLLGRLT